MDQLAVQQQNLRKIDIEVRRGSSAAGEASTEAIHTLKEQAMRGTKIGLGVAAAAVAALPALASLPAPESKSPSALSELQASPAATANLKARLVPPAGIILAQGRPKFVDVNEGPSFINTVRGPIFKDTNKAKPGFKSQSGTPNVKKNFQRFQK